MRKNNRQKDYYYKGFKYWYDFHFRKWIVEVDNEYIDKGYLEYLDKKNQVIPFIECVLVEIENRKKFVNEFVNSFEEKLDKALKIYK